MVPCAVGREAVPPHPSHSSELHHLPGLAAEWNAGYHILGRSDPTVSAGATTCRGHIHPTSRYLGLSEVAVSTPALF